MSSALIGELTAIVGEKYIEAPGLVTDERGFYSAEAIAIIRPVSTEEVSKCVSACAAHEVGMIAQGGNTGMSGGTVPFDDQVAVVINLSRMNVIEDLNPAQFSMTVQAGVTIQAIQEAAAGVDRLFAPDWGARGTAAIGGGISTDAGGLNVVRWGNMRDHVLGIEVVLADGRVWNGLRALRKDSSGYDLKQLFIGGEGTLGIVTRATLKLQHATPYGCTALAALSDFDRLPEVLAFVGARSNGTLTVFELVPEVGLAQVLDKLDMTRPMSTVGEYYALVRFTSSVPVVELLGEAMTAAAAAGFINDAVVATTADQEARLWQMREELPPVRSWPLHTYGVKMDTAVPIDRVVEYLRGIELIAEELVPGCMAYAFGHVGDGNMHTYVLPRDEAQIESFAAQRNEMYKRLDRLAFSLGGTLSAEHGIGRETLGRIEGQKPAIELELMRRIKNTLDPQGLMNPGKMLSNSGDQVFD